MNDPTAPISGEDAAKIRTAAREAVKSMPGARDLGEGDIDMIVARIGGQNASLGDREAMAGGMARTIVESQTNKPINFEAASREKIATYKAALGLPFGGREQLGFLGRNGGDGDGQTSDRGNSSRYDGMRVSALASGVSPAMLDRYMRQYSGMEFGRDAVSTFAAVELKAADCKDLERKGYNRNEIVAAAHDAKDLEFKGKKFVEGAAEAKKENPQRWSEDKKSLRGLETETDSKKFTEKARTHYDRFVKGATTLHARQREQMFYDEAVHHNHAAHAKADQKAAHADQKVSEAKTSEKAKATATATATATVKSKLMASLD